MRSLWLALLSCMLQLSAWAQDDPTRFQVNAVVAPAVEMQTGMSLHWEGESSPDRLWTLSISTLREGRVLRLLAADGVSRNRMGWRPDLDPRPGRLEIRLDELWLAPGQYHLAVELPDGASQSFAFWVREASLTSSREVTVDLPMDVTRLSGWRSDPEQGHHAYAWWPVMAPGRAALDLSPARWILYTDASGIPEGTPVNANQSQVRIADQPWSGEVRTRDQSQDGWVLLWVLPITILFAVMGGFELWRGRNIAGLQSALVLSIGAGVAVIQPVLSDPGAFLLAAQAPDQAPVDSVAGLANMSTAMGPLSAHGNAFAWPDGVSWLTSAGGWLSYLGPSLVSISTDPVTSYNLSIGLGISLLCFFVWVLLRSLGTSHGAALMGGIASALCPRILADLDVHDLDQITLFLIPLFLLMLHRTLRREGWRPPVIAGAILAATVYGQLTFGSFLLLCAPWMVLWRLPGPGIKKRLARAALMGSVAATLLIPAWVLSNQIDEGQTPEIRLVDQPIDHMRPFVDQTAGLYLADAGSGSGVSESDVPMQRLISTVASSGTWQEILFPSQSLPGGALFWPLALLSVLVARRRIITAVALADVGLLLLCYLGPFMRLQSSRAGPALPYYGAYLWVPGFEQLQDIGHFAFMAAALAPIPLALGADGALDTAGRLWARFLHTLRLSLLAGPGRPSLILGIHRIVELLLWQIRASILEPLFVLSVATGAGLGLVGLHSTDKGVQWSLPWPDIHQIPRHPGLRGIQEGSAMALPMTRPIPSQLHLPLIRAGVQLVNAPPIETSPVETTPWVETNPLLNHIAWVSGSDGPDSLLSYDPSQADLYTLDLVKNDLDFFIMFRPLMPSEELTAETEHALDQLFPRVKDDGRVVIWSVRPVAGP